MDTTLDERRKFFDSGNVRSDEPKVKLSPEEIMYPPEKDPRIGGADNKQSKELKRDLIAAFDKMISASQVKELNALWQKVYRLEKALRKELKVSIREYEAKLEE